MTYFADLSPLDYHLGPFDPDEWNCPLLAIGWLEQGFDYQKGECPSDLISRIQFLRHATENTFFQYAFRGLHNCSLSDQKPLLANSHLNLFIPGHDCVYVAPGAIDHYIKHHDYLPPQCFIDAIYSCPDPSGPKYMSTLRAVNKGDEPPLRTS